MRMKNPVAGTEKLCGLFGKTRQAWYKARQETERREMQSMAVIYQVKQVRKDLPRCGGKKLYYLLGGFLENHGIRLGRDKFFDLLRDHNLLIKRKKGRKTTFSFHRFRKYKNIAKGIKVTRPDQLWVSDITYIPLGNDHCYLCLITDAFSRKIVGWALSKGLSAKGPLEALGMALQQRTGKKPLIHHSDRGIQYCCDDYIKKLRTNKVDVSMTENSDPYENALAERMNRTLKEEFLQYRQYFNFDQAVEAVAWAVRMYNNKRPHLSLDYETPATAYAAATQSHVPCHPPAGWRHEGQRRTALMAAPLT